MNLIVIRHAHTQSNTEHRINGHLDESLSNVGREQLPEITSSVHSQQIDIIFSSPLKRAIETAMPIAEDHNTEISIDKRLIEISAGSLTGKTYDSTIELFGVKSTELLDRYSYDFSAFDGETSEQVRQRVQSFLDDLCSKPYENVLIVTHGGILRWINYICTGEKILGQPNGSVLRIKLAKTT